MYRIYYIILFCLFCLFIILFVYSFKYKYQINIILLFSITILANSAYFKKLAIIVKDTLLFMYIKISVENTFFIVSIKK